MDDRKENFGNFLIRRYHEFGLRQPGRFTSMVQFAGWLGVKQSTFSTWIQPDNPKVPSGKNVDLLAEKLGVEVYDALDLPRKMPKNRKLNFIATIWDKLTEDQQNRLYEIAQNLKADQEEAGDRRAAD